MSKKARWLAGYGGMLLLLLVPEFLILGQFILKLTVPDTLKIMAVFAAMFLAAGPLIYKGRMQARERCDARLMTMTLVVLGLVFAVTCAHYAARFGFGKSARYMCSPMANLGKLPREAFVVQLTEAREEWRWRVSKRVNKPGAA